MMRVIVAIDGSADARVAAEWLADFPLGRDTHVLLVAVVNLPASPLDIPTVTTFKDALMAEAREGAEVGRRIAPAERAHQHPRPVPPRAGERRTRLV